MKQLFLMIGSFGITGLLFTASAAPMTPVPVPTPKPMVPPTPFVPQTLVAPTFNGKLPVVTPVLSAKPASVLVTAPIEQDVFNFGAKLISTQIEHTFSFPNTGKVPITIKAVIPSCKCTEVTRFSSVIQPGAIGIIAFRTKMDQAGHKDVNLTAELGGGTVRIFEISGEVVPLLVSSSQPIDSNDFVLPKDVVAKLPGQGIQPVQTGSTNIFLDVRPPAEFSEAHIPNAINVPIFGLSMRSSFAHTPLIIVGSGVDDLALDMQVKACQKMGFQSVHYLKGGMRLWQQNGGALTGVLWNNPHLNTVPSGELVQSARHTTWTIFIPKALGATLTTAPPALCTTVTYTSKADLQNKLKAVVDGNIGLFAPEPDLPNLTASLVASQNCPLFFVSDGWAPYVQLATTEALAQASHLVSVSSGSLAHRIKNCPTCP